MVTVIFRSAARYPIGPAYSATAWKLTPDWPVPQVFFTPMCTMMGLATADRLRAADWFLTFCHLAAERSARLRRHPRRTAGPDCL
jgi:hypothetical protein